MLGINSEEYKYILADFFIENKETDELERYHYYTRASLYPNPYLIRDLYQQIQSKYPDIYEGISFRYLRENEIPHDVHFMFADDDVLTYVEEVEDIDSEEENETSASNYVESAIRQIQEVDEPATNIAHASADTTIPPENVIIAANITIGDVQIVGEGNNFSENCIIM